MAKLISGHVYREKGHTRDCILIIQEHSSFEDTNWYYWNTGWTHSTGWMKSTSHHLAAKLGKDLGSFTLPIDKFTHELVKELGDD